MSVFWKRAAGSDDPEAVGESRAPESGWDAPEPAPAGSLHRPRAREEAARYRMRDTPGDEPAPRQILWRAMLPRSRWGRIAVATGATLLLVVLCAALLGVHSFLLHDDRFVIAASSEIETTGNAHLTRAQVLSVFGEDVERNIFKVPLAERRADLERLPWVQHATVMRLLPNRLRITVVERVPVAFVREGTAIGLVDASGVLLDMPEDTAGDPKYSFPVLSGLSGSDPASTRAARMEIYREFIKQIDGSGTKISDQLSEVDVSDPEDVKAVIPSGGTDVLVHFGDQDFLERYQHFEDHLPEWKQQYPKLASADMRYERQVVLEMQQGTGVPVNDAAGTAVEPGASEKTSPADASGPLASDSKKPSASESRKPVATPPVHHAVHPVVQKKTVRSTSSASKAKMTAAIASARAARTPGVATAAGRAH